MQAIPPARELNRWVREDTAWPGRKLNIRRAVPCGVSHRESPVSFCLHIAGLFSFHERQVQLDGQGALIS